MSDDWQEAAFSNRHTHNRGQQGRGGKANSHGFNVQKTFGSYEIKSPKFPSPNPKEESKPARLEIYTLNEQGNALIGELFIPGCLNANVLMAGSRKVMKRVLRDLVERDDADDPQPEEDDVDREVKPDDGGAGEEEEEEEDEQEEEGEESDEEELKEKLKAREFEKNSFRSPKFWLKWQGQLLNDDAAEEEILTDGGYIVFSGNTCEKFDGTLSCEKLGWKNAKVSGWKIKGMSARDFEIDWLLEEEDNV